MNIDETISCIRIWGIQKGISGPNGKATVRSQYNKLIEEMNELKQGIEKDDETEIVDAIGDCFVVLTLLAERAGYAIEECALSAYDEIKNRTGRMENSTFVKDQ